MISCVLLNWYLMSFRYNSLESLYVLNHLSAEEKSVNTMYCFGYHLCINQVCSLKNSCESLADTDKIFLQIRKASSFLM